MKTNFLKRSACLLLVLILIVGILPLTTFAASTVKSGTCGDNLTWKFDSNGVLTISGTGNMYSYNSYGNEAPWKSVKYQIKEIVIKSGVTSIGNYAFLGCSSATKVTLPDTITKIGERCFFLCEGLRTVEIPYGVKTIPTSAFNGCSSMTSIIIPETVQSFGQSAFEDCSSLEYFIIPDGVREISHSMFWGCSGLEYVQIPASVTEIDTFAFHECGNLSDIYYTGTRTQFANIEIDSLNKYNEGLLNAVVHYSSKAPCKTHAYGPGELTLAPTPDRDGKKVYTCTICGNTKTETYGKEHAAHIVKQTNYSQTALNGTAKVSVTAKGDGLTYQWYFRNENKTSYSKSSVTSASYSTTMTEGSRNRRVYCVITDKYGNSVQSETVMLRMAASIKKQPTSVTVDSGAKATVKVEALGEGLTYTWYYSTNGGASFTKTTSFTGNSYYLTMNASRSGRKVYCVVKDKYGNEARTNTVTLSMGNVAKIKTQPQSVTVEKGKTATVTIKAAGDGLKYQWYFKNANKDTFTKSSVTGAKYSTTMTDGANGRQVYCVITDKYGNSVTSKTVTLSMPAKAAITTQPKDVYVSAIGETAKVTVKATGDGLTYQWYFKNANKTSFSKSSVTGSSYSTTMTSSVNGRQVYCVVTDKYGNSVTSKTVTLYLGDPIQITAQPETVVVKNGETASVTVSAIGEGLTYKWYIKNASGTKFSLSSAFTGATYSVTMDSSRSGRQVYCVITDKYGKSVKTDIATLFMGNPVQLTAQPESVLVEEGETARVTVNATGDGLTYKWYFKEANGSKFSLTSSFTGNAYYIAMNKSRNGRQVYCVITDKYGNSVTTDTVTLYMMETVNITKQPTSVTVASGATASVTVEATGDGLTYAWYYKSSSDYSFTLSTAFTGNTYSLEMSSKKDGYQVYCVVTDAYGNSERSNTVTLSMSSSGSGSGSGSSTTLPSGLTGIWDSTALVSDGQVIPLYTWWLSIYSTGTVHLYMDSSSTSYRLSYMGYSDGVYYYNMICTSGARDLVLAYDYYDDEVCVLVDEDGIFFEK